MKNLVLFLLLLFVNFNICCKGHWEGYWAEDFVDIINNKCPIALDDNITLNHVEFLVNHVVYFYDVKKVKLDYPTKIRLKKDIISALQYNNFKLTYRYYKDGKLLKEYKIIPYKT